MKIKYVHTNLIARDWKKLAKFYIHVFQCRVKLPERNLKGEWLDLATSLKNVHLRGIHLYFPGYNEQGPTLEIFQYAENEKNDKRLPNKEGFAHLAFSVDSIEECIELIKNNGGGLIGQIVNAEIDGVGKIHFAYAHDPEGNIIEIQEWE